MSGTDIPTNEANLTELGLVPELEAVMRAWLPADSPGTASAASPGRTRLQDEIARRFGPRWRIELDAPELREDVGGWSLWDTNPSGSKRLWVVTDGLGIHTVARWDDRGLARARIRLPGGGWVALHPKAGTHPLWGPCDVVTSGGASVARMPAQNYLALSELPPLDRPEAMPPGAGAAVLNFLARLWAVRGTVSVRYRGPYPTAHLFDALCRSFAWSAPGFGETPKERLDARAALRAQFSAEEWSAALEAAPLAWRRPEISWHPDPWTPLRPHPDLLVHWRRGPEMLWIGEDAFASAGVGEPEMGGSRIRKIAGRYEAGLFLLGRLWRAFVRLGEDGALLDYSPPNPGPEAPWKPMPEPWPRVASDWATLVATPALAGAVAQQQEEVTLGWMPWPTSLARLSATPTGVRVGIQSGIVEQFRSLARQGHPPADLALLAVSDALGGAERILRRLALQRLMGQATPDPEALITAGTTAQDRARERLQRDLPELVNALANGEAWGI